MHKLRSNVMKVNQETYGLVLHHLMHVGPATNYELCEITGLHLITMQSLSRVLRRHEVLYISGWEFDKRNSPTIPIFALNTGRHKDTPRPKRTKAEIASRYRARREKRLVDAAAAGINRPLKDNLSLSSS